MQWNRRYVVKSYVRNSLWLMPFFAVVLYWVVSSITLRIDGWLLQTGQIDSKTAFLGLTMVGARSVLDTIVTLNLSFLVFTFGSLLIAIGVLMVSGLWRVFISNLGSVINGYVPAL